jgi:hypothetical protein
VAARTMASRTRELWRKPWEAIESCRKQSEAGCLWLCEVCELSEVSFGPVTVEKMSLFRHRHNKLISAISDRLKQTSQTSQTSQPSHAGSIVRKLTGSSGSP